MRLLFIGMLLLSNTFLKADELISRFPADFSARYELYKNGLPLAETEYRLSRQKQIRFSASTELTGLMSLFGDDSILEETLFDITSPKEIKIRHYQFEQSGNSPQSINSAVNWQTKTISTTINDKPVLNNTFKHAFWDKHSVFLALMIHASSDKDTLSFPTLDQGEIKQYKFRLIGQKEIEVSDGTNDDVLINTVVWENIRNSKKTLFYLDPSESYIPLKIEQYKDQQLRATLWLNELKWYE